MRGRSPTNRTERALSPVVGTVLFVAVVVLLVGASATVIFGLTDTQSPAPTVALSLEPTDVPGEYAIIHEEGATLEGEQVRLRGVVDADALGSRDLTAGERVVVDPHRETVEVVWFAEPRTDADSYIVSELDVTDVDSTSSTSSSPSAIGGLGGTVVTGDGTTVKTIEGDGGEVDTVSVSGTVGGLGPAAVDVTGNGELDVPYVTTGGELRVTDVKGNGQLLATDADIPDAIEYQKTRLASGSWNGSTESVFFVNQNHDTIYRVAPGGSPVAVATPDNSAQAVIDVADVDDDGTDELVFADGSQHLRYLEPSNGTVVKLTNGGAGSSNGIGTAALADLDDDGVPAVVFVDGSNNVVVNREASGGGTTTITLGDAAKSPPTAADVDGDDDLELVYVSTDTDSKFKYVDDPEGANTVKVLEDDAADPVEGDDETGAV